MRQQGSLEELINSWNLIWLEIHYEIIFNLICISVNLILLAFFETLSPQKKIVFGGPRTANDQVTQLRRLFRFSLLAIANVVEVYVFNVSHICICFKCYAQIKNKLFCPWTSSRAFTFPDSCLVKWQQQKSGWWAVNRLKGINLQKFNQLNRTKQNFLEGISLIFWGKLLPIPKILKTIHKRERQQAKSSMCLT